MSKLLITIWIVFVEFLNFNVAIGTDKIEIKKTLIYIKYQLFLFREGEGGGGELAASFLFESVYNNVNFEDHSILFKKMWRLTSIFKGLLSKKLKGHTSPCATCLFGLYMYDDSAIQGNVLQRSTFFIKIRALISVCFD